MKSVLSVVSYANPPLMNPALVWNDSPVGFPEGSKRCTSPLVTNSLTQKPLPSHATPSAWNGTVNPCVDVWATGSIFVITVLDAGPIVPARQMCAPSNVMSSVPDTEKETPVARVLRFLV